MDRLVDYSHDLESLRESEDHQDPLVDSDLIFDQTWSSLKQRRNKGRWTEEEKNSYMLAVKHSSTWKEVFD